VAWLVQTLDVRRVRGGVVVELAGRRRARRYSGDWWPAGVAMWTWREAERSIDDGRWSA